MEEFFESILIMICEYRGRSVFNVITIGVDKTFESIKSELENKPYQVSLTTYNANRYVQVIKRMIKFVNERIRVVQLVMPYEIILKRFTIEMFVFWSTLFLVKVDCTVSYLLEKL